VHVRDAAHGESEAQKADVLKVLAELGIEPDGERPMFEALNKIDLLDASARKGLLSHNTKVGPIAISALTGQGLDALVGRIDGLLSESSTTLVVDLDHSDGAGLAWAYAHGRVASRRERAQGLRLHVSVDPQDIDRFLKRFGGKISLQQEIRRAS